MSKSVMPKELSEHQASQVRYLTSRYPFSYTEAKIRLFDAHWNLDKAIEEIACADWYGDAESTEVGKTEKDLAKYFCENLPTKGSDPLRGSSVHIQWTGTEEFKPFNEKVLFRVLWVENGMIGLFNEYLRPTVHVVPVRRIQKIKVYLLDSAKASATLPLHSMVEG